MKSFLLLMIAAVTTLFFSCDPCSNLDCAGSNYYGQFRIISATTGNDLLFGTNRVYNKSQFKFYSLKGTDTTFLDYQTIKESSAGYDSILVVNFYPKIDVAYMRLSNGDIDTFNIFYQTADTKCCGTVTKITSFKYNNTVDIPGNKGTQELRK